MNVPRATPRPKIAFVVTASCSLGFLAGQLEYLRSQGFDVSVISSAGPEQDATRQEGASVFTVSMEREIAPAKDLLSLWRLWRLMRRIRPDLTIVGTPKAGLLGGLASLLAGVPKRIYVLHGLRLETTVEWKRRLLAGCEWLACHCAHNVRCVSRSLRARAIELGLVAPDRCSVVGEGTSNGVQIDRWRRTPEAEATARQTRECLRIPPDAPVVGFVGRLTRDKGIVDLYGAFIRLQPVYLDLRLLLVGDFEAGDPVTPALRAQIVADSSVIRAGFVTDVAPYYWAMDVLALPTYREGFGNVCVEAQAASIPVVTTDSTGVIDAIIDGVTGIRVPVGDVEALTAALGRLLGDPLLRARMGQAGCAWVEQNFERKTVWKNLLANYRSILQSAPVNH
jgi:glycosyltransferase involved in cell wall biosynthesis